MSDWKMNNLATFVLPNGERTKMHVLKVNTRKPRKPRRIVVVWGGKK